jgi:hypothetical protein
VNFVDTLVYQNDILNMSGSATMRAKNAVKRAHLAEMTLRERLMHPLYLHYRNQVIQSALRKSVERTSNQKNS